MEHARGGEEGRREEPQSSSMPTPRFNEGVETLNPLNNIGGTYSLNGMMDFPRFPISEMHLGKFPDTLELQSWKVNFKTEVCAKSAFPHITMHWIKEVEMAESIDDLLTSRSIQGRKDFSVYDAMIASALKKLLTHVHFRKKSKCRRAACSERPPIPMREAGCIHDL